MFKWLTDLLDNLFKPKEKPKALVIPLKKSFRLAWFGEHPDFQEWDQIVFELVRASQLPDLFPKDVLSFYPQYAFDRETRVEFWCQLLSIMAKYESGFDPLQFYKEDFNDSKGKPVISRGLLQLSFESCNGYGAGLTSEEQLHDVRTNLRCAILILERWVSRHQVLQGGEIGSWQGGAKYWSVLRGTSKSKPKIMDYLKRLYQPMPEITLDQIRDKIVFHMMKNEGQKETHGKNRSPIIDAILKRVNSSLGNPYCAAAVWCAIDDTCKDLSLKNPVGKTASSQKLFTQSPKEYQKQDHGKKGDGFILQSRKDKSRGHAGVVRENQVHLKTFFTIEANTDGEGSRDGDGWYKKSRSLDGDSSKSFRGFVDFAQWIYDFNQLEAS